MLLAFKKISNAKKSILESLSLYGSYDSEKIFSKKAIILLSNKVSLDNFGTDVSSSRIFKLFLAKIINKISISFQIKFLNSHSSFL